MVLRGGQRRKGGGGNQKLKTETKVEGRTKGRREQLCGAKRERRMT